MAASLWKGTNKQQACDGLNLIVCLILVLWLQGNNIALKPEVCQKVTQFNPAAALFCPALLDLVRLARRKHDGIDDQYL